MRKKIGVGTESMRRFLRISTQRAKGSAEGAPPDGVVAGDAANAKTKPNGNHPTPMGHPATGGKSQPKPSDHLWRGMAA